MSIPQSLAAAAFAVIVAAPASATTLSFIDEAAGNERGVADGTTIADFQGTGIDVTLSATGGSAYFDDLSGGRPGGLGVCTRLSRIGAQCIPSWDDNISRHEAVFLSFAEAGVTKGGTIDSGLFHDSDHRRLNGAFEYSLDGGAAWLTANVVNGFFAFDSTFTTAGMGFRYTGDQFYVSALGGDDVGINLVTAPVPLPASAWFLATALLAAAGIRRSKAPA